MTGPHSANRILYVVSALALATLSPVPLVTLSPKGDALVRASLPAAAQPVLPVHEADLDSDGLPETITLVDGLAIITRGQHTLWSSDPAWRVVQAQATDLNRDGHTELALLVWRPFAPWPIDAYLPHPGRISTFHDEAGRSCHLILIGWRGRGFGELWAGSALVDPLLSFSVADLDADGFQELIALEGRYEAPAAPARAVTLWAWNGFGFTLQARSAPGRYRGLMALHLQQGPDLVLVDGTIWR
jgi:hypothetical protein